MILKTNDELLFSSAGALHNLAIELADPAPPEPELDEVSNRICRSIPFHSVKVRLRELAPIGSTRPILAPSRPPSISFPKFIIISRV